MSRRSPTSAAECLSCARGRGWPGAAPYRSIGVEPMLGRAAELGGSAGDPARVGADGTARWTLELRAFRR